MPNKKEMCDRFMQWITTQSLKGCCRRKCADMERRSLFLFTDFIEERKEKYQ